MSKGLARPRIFAVPGMNWAMPSAPAGLTAPGSKRLSFQIRRARKSFGRPCRSASVAIRSQTSPSNLSRAESACGGSASAARTKASHARQSRQAANAPHHLLLGRLGLDTAAEAPLDIVGDHFLEFLGDARATQGCGLLAIDEHRCHRHLAGTGQGYADVGMLGFARPVEDAAHHRHLELLDAWISLAPDRHVGPDVLLDRLGEFLEYGRC